MPTSDERYWAEYDGLQHAKHQLLRAYLGGWFPILSSWHGRVLYVDCHAGRGRHETGHEGSPILALRLLKVHRSRKQILSETEVNFYLFENNQANYEVLEAEIAELGSLPSNMLVHPHQEDYQSHLQGEFEALRSRGQQLAACFAFIDPYGFSISNDFINEILSFPATEVLVNFMYRYINMAITHDGQAENMDVLFGSGEWRELGLIEDITERSNATVSLFSSQLQAEYVTQMYMRGENNALKYALIHATNHRKGRELIKDAMWSVIPDGTFTASERATPDQPVLIVPEPDLRPLEDAM
ncbi:MAG: three-Cys-motif partner protein TcmP [Anaerolineales bacterium]